MKHMAISGHEDKKSPWKRHGGIIQLHTSDGILGERIGNVVIRKGLGKKQRKP